MNVTKFSLVLLWCAAMTLTAIAGDESPAQRVPWRSSRVTGSPDPPPPFVASRVFPEMNLKEPVFIVWSSDLNRFFVGEKRGVVSSLVNRPDAQPELAFDLTMQLDKSNWPRHAAGIDALYAIAFHPNFAENRTCYVCYTLTHEDRKVPNLADGSRISRFQMLDSNPPRLDPDSEEVLLTWEQGGHNGCELKFGPDGYLYISTGDARPPNPPDELHTGQDITDLLSSVLRIDVDRCEPGKQYAIPPDNPFIGLTIDEKTARPEVWAYGFRNPWRMSFDRQTGQLWLADVGWELWEMVHRVERGGNYGWSVVEGRQLIHANDLPGPTPIQTPLLELPHTIAASITGGYVYRGKRFPELVGAYVFGDWEFRRLWAAQFENDRLVSLTELTRPTVRVVSFGEDSEGELLFLDYDTGFVHTLERNDGRGRNEDFPVKLSDTGLFAVETEPRRVSETPAAGVVPFEINAPQWQDDAQAQRWLALPGTSSITVYSGEGKPMPSQVFWHNFRLHFPKDAVLVKTLSLETTPSDPASRRKIETQLLHFDGADWRAYSYAWRDDQTDADLVPAAGDEKTIVLRDDTQPSRQRPYVWQFQDRTQCLQCHSQWPQYAVGFNLSQLNRNVMSDSGSHVNQLAQLSRTGHLVRRALDDTVQPPYDARSAAAEDRLPDPFDTAAAPLTARARSYLHANCSHCHRFNGGGIVGLDLLFNKTVAEARILESPIRGDFGLPEARIVAPGHPERSTLYFRMAKFGRDRMPHVGSERPDEAGLQLIADWITALDGDSQRIDEPQTASTIEQQLAQPQLAQRWARRLGRGELSADERKSLIRSAMSLEPGALRDLFEGYLPVEGHEPKLGPRPRPASIISLTGDHERGKKLFWAKSSNCATCHKVGNEGVNLGPELTRIGQKRTRDELLDSLLNSSRTVDPAFAAYLLVTKDGLSISGLLVRRTPTEIVLRDAKNREIVIPSDELERLTVSRVSLMPDGLLASFTAQQAADLVAYLTSLRE